MGVETEVEMEATTAIAIVLSYTHRTVVMMALTNFGRLTRVKSHNPANLTVSSIVRYTVWAATSYTTGTSTAL
jgi:hypothetical protein